MRRVGAAELAKLRQQVARLVVAPQRVGADLLDEVLCVGQKRVLEVALVLVRSLVVLQVRLVDHLGR